MSSDISDSESYFRGPTGVVFAKTALPIIFVMSANGLLTVMDAMFLGIYVGPQAVGAVTIVFPVFMMLVALSTLVSTGMASLLARYLGARRFDDANAVFISASLLAVLMGGLCAALYGIWGWDLIQLVTHGSQRLAQMADCYLRILMLTSPLQFLLAVNADALRSEGRLPLMAVISLVVSFTNIAFNFLLIGVMGWGVAGSAYGTVLAQALALALVIVFRHKWKMALRYRLWPGNPLRLWGKILTLGIPQSFSFVGVACVSASIMAALRWTGDADYLSIVTAYGVVIRVLTFTYLPLLGLNQAMQSIVGNLIGAGEHRRAGISLRFALGVALVFGLVVEAVLFVFPARIGSYFVTDPEVILRIAHIMPIMVALYALTGPMMMAAGFFQATGDARRAVLLALVKPFVFTVPLVFLMSWRLGEAGLWYALPIADALLLVLTLTVLWSNHIGSHRIKIAHSFMRGARR